MTQLRLSPITVILTVFGLIFMGGFWFLLMPVARHIGEVATQLEQVRKEESAATNPTASSSTKAAKVQAAQNEKRQAELLMPFDDNQYDLTVQIEALARSLGVTITSYTIGNAAASGAALGPKTSVASSDDSSTSTSKTATPAPSASTGQSITARKLTVTVGISASYANVQQFVSALTRIERFMQIDQVAISGSGDSAVTATVTAFAYSLAGPAAAPTPSPSPSSHP